MNKASKNDVIIKSQEMCATRWHVLRDGQQLGPFSRLELIKMLQTKGLVESDFIWADHLDTWVRVFDCIEFSPNEIANIYRQRDQQAKGVFCERRWPRVRYEANVLVHDSKRMLSGLTREIGAGGVGLLLRGQNLDCVDQLFLHFRSGVELPAFNALGRVVSRRRATETDWAICGVKFTSIHSSVSDCIDNFVRRRKAVA
ncbi:MAG: GYF domain-containing protein [Bdellovibrionaceae bacterium]|nr:GYF domain-containing protein [Pseudobdellovibrionaceae bacterium]